MEVVVIMHYFLQVSEEYQYKVDALFTQRHSQLFLQELFEARHGGMHL